MLSNSDLLREICECDPTLTLNPFLALESTLHMILMPYIAGTLNPCAPLVALCVWLRRGAMTKL